MVWVCSFCGKAAKTKRLKCSKCGNMSWRASRTRELAEIAGPMKQIAPRGLLLGPARRQQPKMESGIECGKCHLVIYRPDREFDAEAFQKAKKMHHELSPTCEPESREQ